MTAWHLKGNDVKKPILTVINGGGCRQIECATGVLQALDAAGVRIDRYTGSSAGAAVAALHASGMTGAELETMIRETPCAGAVPALLDPSGAVIVWRAGGSSV